MTINLEAAGARQAPSARYDGQHAEARQDRWLFELEHALLQLGTKKVSSESDPAGRGVTDEHAGELGGKPHKRRTAAGEMPLIDVAAAQAGRAELARLPDSGPGALPSVRATAASAVAFASAQSQRLDGAAMAGAAPVPALAAIDQPGQGAPAEMVGAAPAMAASLGGASAPVVGLAAPGVGTSLSQVQGPGPTSAPVPETAEAGVPASIGQQAWHDAGVRAALAVVQADGSAGSVAAAGPTGAYAVGGAALRRAAVGGAETGAGTLARAQAARPAALAASLGMAPDAGQAAQQEAAQPAQEEVAPQHAERREQADGAPFEKKLLHLYRGAEGVQAWIRDAELNAAQIRGVARALAAELEGGTRLAALTINGRKIIAAPHLPGAGAEEDDYIQPAGDDSASAPFAVRAYTFGGTV